MPTVTFCTPSVVLAALTLTLTLASCGNTALPTSSGTLSSDTLSTERVLSVPTSEATGRAAALNATVVGTYGDRTILSFTPHASGLSALSLQAGEANTASFHPTGSIGLWANGSNYGWANGSIYSWANGSIGLWGEGAIGLWGNGGLYVALPGNSTAWNSLKLREAQTVARHLGSNVVIAVVDSGLDLNHPAFAKSLVNARSMHDFVANTGVPQEQGNLNDGAYGHGTAVAGIALQMAPRAKIMPVRVLSPDGSGTPLNVAQGVLWAYAHGADIINLSIGSTDPSPLVEDAVRYVTGHGVLVTASSGNTGSDHSEYPAADLRVDHDGLSVGSSVSDGSAASVFSNHGPELAVLAPGERIGTPFPDNRQAQWTGTSMSAPVIAGELALALGEHGKVDNGDQSNQDNKDQGSKDQGNQDQGNQVSALPALIARTSTAVNGSAAGLANFDAFLRSAR